jgi:hypothetical protein
MKTNEISKAPALPRCPECRAEHHGNHNALCTACHDRALAKLATAGHPMLRSRSGGLL